MYLCNFLPGNRATGARERVRLSTQQARCAWARPQWPLLWAGLSEAWGPASPGGRLSYHLLCQRLPEIHFSQKQFILSLVVSPPNGSLHLNLFVNLLFQMTLDILILYFCASFMFE